MDPDPAGSAVAALRLRGPARAGISRALASFPRMRSGRALSSAGEHFLDMEGVTGSIPVAPTTPGFAFPVHMNVDPSQKMVMPTHATVNGVVAP